LVSVVAAAAGLWLAGCQSVYYDTMERFGYEKREILVDRVEAARESQEEAKEQFESALEQFQAVTGFEGGDLEREYRRLKAELDASEDRADEVRERIEGVESVAGDLFSEWRDELGQYSSPELRRASERQLRETERRYEQLIATMRRAESKIDPVLDAFRDRVLFLKHNLNARAIASLRSDLGEVQSDIASLVSEMNTSIAEADAFIESMR
jgi:hypothetical protein